MTWTRKELEAELAALDKAVAQLLREHEDPAHFWPAFVKIADALEDQAAPGDFEWVQYQIDLILERHDLDRREG